VSASIFGARYTVRIDPPAHPASGVQYIGWAQPATLTSEDAWSIARLTWVSDSLSLVEWGGVVTPTNRFENIWDNRAALTYG
jgi:hypothetical protein